jgi:hypothetical protein
MVVTDATKSELLLRRIRSEYLEMPGTSLTKPQMQRLWRLDAGTCDIVVDQLVEAGFLRQTRSRGYVRAADR